MKGIHTVIARTADTKPSCYFAGTLTKIVEGLRDDLVSEVIAMNKAPKPTQLAPDWQVASDYSKPH